jgi:hypothetical protein
VRYDGLYASDVNDAMPKIERLSGMKFKRPPQLAITTRDSLRAALDREFERQSADDLPGMQAAYRMLDLIPDTMDLRALMLDMYTEQIAGLYRPETKTLYLIEGTPREMRVPIISHELVHALQDQYADLSALQEIERDDDRQLAASAVMEGQATLIGLEMQGHIASWPQLRAQIQRQQQDQPIFAAAPMFIQESLLFPYLSGAEFMRQFYETSSDSMPFGDQLAASTEQIMHPAAYAPVRDAPTRVELPDPSGASRVYDNNLGEFGTRLLLYLHDRSQPKAVSGATGWDGDRYMVIKTDRGPAIVWVTIWDSTVDAAEFGIIMEEGIDRRFDITSKKRDADGASVRITPERTLVVRGGQISGRPAVMYVDVPKGVSTDLVSWDQIKLSD